MSHKIEMKYNFKRIIFSILTIIFIHAICANASSEQSEFPIQPYFLEDKSLNKFINPFKMPSIQLGKPIVKKSHRQVTSILMPQDIPTLAPKGLKALFLHLFSNSFYDMKAEIPYHRTKNSIKLIYNCDNFVIPIVGIQIFQEPEYKNKQFSITDAQHGCIGFTWKKCFFASILPCALTITPQVGITVLGIDSTENDSNISCWGCVGGALGVDLGLEAYFNQWFAGYIEYSYKAHIIGPSIVKRSTLVRSIETKSKSFSYHTSAFVVGIKTTFQI